MKRTLTFLVVLAGATALLAEEPPAPTLRQRAVEQVLSASRSEDRFLRANAIEAAGPIKEHLVPLAQLGVRDEQAVVRFAALVMIGRQPLRDLGPLAREQAAREAQRVEQVRREVLEKGEGMTDVDRRRLRQALSESESAYAAALFAARRCGQPVDISPLSTLLGRRDPSVRSNVAMLLGMLGDPSAVPLLREAARQPLPRANNVQAVLSRLQIAEAMVKLGDDASLDAVRAGAYSHLEEVRVVALSMLGSLGDHQMEKGMAALLAKPPVEIQLACVASLRRLGRAEGLDLTLEAAGSVLPPVRAQAAAILGLMKEAQAREMLAKLLDDPEQTVRLSAAAAILVAGK